MTPLFALSTLATLLLGLGAVAVVFILFGVGTFNTLVALRNRYKNAFSQIDVQLKRRNDLIPNLVEIAKGYMAHERDTLEAVINARNKAVTAQQTAASSPGDPSAMNSLGAAEAQVSGALGRLFALAESYPDLKANQNMLALQEELTSTENKVAFARQSFNDAVMNYNTQCERFPNSLIAGIGGFAPRSYSSWDRPRNEKYRGSRSDRDNPVCRSGRAGRGLWRLGLERGRLPMDFFQNQEVAQEEDGPAHRLFRARGHPDHRDGVRGDRGSVCAWRSREIRRAARSRCRRSGTRSSSARSRWGRRH